MAKRLRIAGKVTMKDVDVAEFLTWLLKEVKQEIEDMCDENVRMSAIVYEAKRLLKKYDIVR